MPEDQEPTSSDSAGSHTSELVESVAREREARKTRRRLERERQREAVEARRPRAIYTDLMTVSGRSEIRSQRGAYTSARADVRTETRRIESTITVDGALKTEVFGFVDGEWKSLGAIVLDVPSA